MFTVDETFRWYVASDNGLEVLFPANGWLTSEGFEQPVRKAGSPLECTMPDVSFRDAQPSAHPDQRPMTLAFAAGQLGAQIDERLA